MNTKNSIFEDTKDFFFLFVLHWSNLKDGFTLNFLFCCCYRFLSLEGATLTGFRQKKLWWRCIKYIMFCNGAVTDTSKTPVSYFIAFVTTLTLKPAWWHDLLSSFIFLLKPAQTFAGSSKGLYLLHVCDVEKRNRGLLDVTSTLHSSLWHCFIARAFYFCDLYLARIFCSDLSVQQQINETWDGCPSPHPPPPQIPAFLNTVTLVNIVA